MQRISGSSLYKVMNLVNICWLFSLLKLKMEYYVAGIMAAKILSENGVSDFMILEATDRIGGRLCKWQFGKHTVELGAGWIQGVGGNVQNPILELASQHNLRTCNSDYSNIKFNIYDQSGALVPSSEAAVSYKLAVESANCELAREASAKAKGRAHVSDSSGLADSSPIELAIDYILHDFEMADVEPIPTYTEFGPRECLVADERGYEYLIHKLAQQFLNTKNGSILDSRLKLQKVVREIQYTKSAVRVKTEDGSVYTGKWGIVSVSLGVLQSDLIRFTPQLPRWKMGSFYNCEFRIYTKIFLKFPHKFWPTGEGTEFFLYADQKRGYYTFWQHMENAYPGSNILVVTVTNEESKRIELQSSEKTKAEAMAVLKKIFGKSIPEVQEILVPKWWNNPFQRGSYSNYPIFVNLKHFEAIRAPVGPVFFTGEHTNEKFNGYVHGGYFSGIDTANMVTDRMKKDKRTGKLHDSWSSSPD
ncbi:hypothetical protein SUGI_0995010 [Cryptomeria japonica]|nr:hypothetical protein SUGI_0995010 [Cryptomeria japonica]